MPKINQSRTKQMATSAAAEIIAQIRKNDSETKKGSSQPPSSSSSSSLSSLSKKISIGTNIDQGEEEECSFDNQFLTDEEDLDLNGQFEGNDEDEGD